METVWEMAGGGSAGTDCIEEHEVTLAKSLSLIRGLIEPTRILADINEEEKRGPGEGEHRGGGVEEEEEDDVDTMGE